MSVELRPPRREDAAAIAVAFERFGRMYGADVESAADLETWFGNPGLDMECDARVATAGGRIVGYGDASDAARDGRFVHLDVRVDPAHRGEAEPALMDFVEHRAGELAASGGIVKAWAPESAKDLRGLIESRGYAFDSYGFRMGAGLDGDLSEPLWPPGISVRKFRRDGDTETVYEAHQEAFSEEPDHFRDPFDEWLHWSFREPFDPDLWFLAFDGEELAGISLCRPEALRGGSGLGTSGGDSSVGWVQILAVRKPWRKRGLGLALLLHSFNELRARGKRRVGLGVHGENFGARRLYEKAGMSVERTSAWYRKIV